MLSIKQTVAHVLGLISAYYQGGQAYNSQARPCQRVYVICFCQSCNWISIPKAWEDKLAMKVQPDEI